MNVSSYSNNSHFRNILFVNMHNSKLLTGLIIFAQVAQARSFTRAAEHLGMSKSAVSQSVRRLEKEIGTQLLLRNTRSVTLTIAGERLVEKTQFLQDEVDQALAEAASAQDDPSGLFSLTYPPMLEEQVIMPALRQLSREFRKLHFRTVATETPLDLLRDKLDVAIFAGELADSSYRALPLGVVSDGFYASSQMFSGRDFPEQPEDLLTREWVVPTWQEMPTRYHIRNSAKKVLSHASALRIQPYMTCTTMASLVEAVREGLGVALIPDLAALPFVQNGTLVRVAPRYRGRSWSFSFVHPYLGDKPKHMTRFYELTRHFFSKALVG